MLRKAKFLLSPIWWVTVPQRAVSRLYTYYILTHFSAPTEPLTVSTLFNLISMHSLICLRLQQNLAYKPGCWLEFLLAGLGEEGRAAQLLMLLPQDFKLSMGSVQKVTVFRGSESMVQSCCAVTLSLFWVHQNFGAYQQNFVGIAISPGANML